MLAHMCGDAREVKSVSTLRSVNRCALPRLHAVQADSTATPESEAVFEEGELERGTRRGWI